jgi:hypothetical protein
MSKEKRKSGRNGVIWCRFNTFRGENHDDLTSFVLQFVVLVAA